MKREMRSKKMIKNMPIKINHDDHTITTLKPGYVWYLITIEEKGESGSLTTESIQLNITVKEKAII